MKYTYTAKIYLEDGEVILHSGNNVEELMVWMHGQAEASFGDMNGEIIDNKTHHVVKHFQYTPPFSDFTHD